METSEEGNRGGRHTGYDSHEPLRNVEICHRLEDFMQFNSIKIFPATY